MRADLTSLGVLGYFVANSDTVGRGLQALREFLHVHDQGAAPFLIEEDGIAMLGYEVLDPGIDGAEQMSFGALAIAAKAFGMSRRSLARRLKTCGSSFRSVVDAARFDAARIILESPRITIVEVAARLGCSDSSTFARAFRRWSGTSPALWRRRNGGT